MEECKNNSSNGKKEKNKKLDDKKTIVAKWISDKQGRKIEEKIINPMIEYANEVLNEFIGDATKNTERDMKLKYDALGTLEELKTEKFKTQLKNKLAGHFQLKRFD